MTTVQFLNILFAQCHCSALMSYYWSFWTYKLFKPFRWLDFVKDKLIPNSIHKAERQQKEKVWFYMLWLQLERINKHQIEGSLAEVGVYNGNSAKIIREMLPNRLLHLFDTFDGYPEDAINEQFDSHERINRANYNDCNEEKVQHLLGNQVNTVIHKGIFPETATSISDNETFALVHLDADLYEPTFEGLKYFYPKLVPGGVIIVENYNHNWPGVTAAVDQFANNIPETFVEMPNQYGAGVLIKNKITL